MLTDDPTSANSGVEDSVYRPLYRCVLYAVLRGRARVEYEVLGLEFQVPRNLISSAPASAIFTKLVRALEEVRG